MRQDLRDEITKESAKHADRMAWKARAFEYLPDGVPVPTVSNESNKAFFGHGGAWLSFNNQRYGEVVYASNVLSALEGAGWKPLNACRVKWDNYRAGIEPGHWEDIPETKGRYECTMIEAIAPLWCTIPTHGEPKLHAFYEAPNGFWFKVTVHLPQGMRATAEREMEYRGNRNFATGRIVGHDIHMPERWQAIDEPGNVEGNHIACARPEVFANAYGGLELHVEGRVTWLPLAHEQADYPATPAQMAEQLEPQV